jgi:hypothetical protein
VILRLVNIGKKYLVTIGQSLVVILIGCHGRFCSGNDGVGLLLISRLWRSKRSHIHVAGHMRHIAMLIAI